MVKFTDKPNLDGRTFKTRVAGREPSELTLEIQEKIGGLKVGKGNGTLLELEAGEDIKNVRPKIAQAAKKYKFVIRTETLADDSGLHVWRESGEYQPRPRKSKDSGDGAKD